MKTRFKMTALALLLGFGITAQAAAGDSAVSYYNQGGAKQTKDDLDGAIADYNHAIELDPKYVGAYYNRGAAKQAKGDLDGAVADYNHAIELNPKYANAYNNRGIVKHAKGELDGAIADYRHFCELSESGQDYPRLYIWLIRSHLGETEAASKELSAYLDKRTNAAPGDWFSKVSGHLLGNITEAELFAADAPPDAKKARGRSCEAWFYAGMKKLLSGNKKTAATYFQKCLATEQKNYAEYHLAQAELKALAP